MIGGIIVTIITGLFAYCCCVVSSESDNYHDDEPNDYDEPE